MTRRELRALKELREDEFFIAVGQVYEAQYKDSCNKLKRFSEDIKDE